MFLLLHEHTFACVSCRTYMNDPLLAYIHYIQIIGCKSTFNCSSYQCRWQVAHRAVVVTPVRHTHTNDSVGQDQSCYIPLLHGREKSTGCSEWTWQILESWFTSRSFPPEVFWHSKKSTIHGVLMRHLPLFWVKFDLTHIVLKTLSSQQMQ